MKNGIPRIPDTMFKEIVKEVPICTVDIVLFNKEKDKILLCKRINKPLEGIFMTNGGRLLKNEELEDAAVRVAKEELGIELNKADLIPGGITNQICDSSIFENINYHAVDFFFGYITDESLKIKLDNQNSAYEWFPVNDESLHPYVRKEISVLLKN